MENNDRILLIDLYNHFYNNIPNDLVEMQYNYFKSIKFLIINHINKKCKVYSPALAYLFYKKDINAKNMETKKLFKLATQPYLKTFIEAFEKGEEYFKCNYEVDKDILYSSNKNIIVSDIHDAYYHTNHSSKFIGWNEVHSNPYIVTHKIIDDYGFYSGVLSKADEFINKYPNIFTGFHSCAENDKEPNHQNKKSNINKPTLNEIALKYAYLNKTITRENSKIKAIENGYTSGDALYNKFTFYYSTANRKGKPNPYTKKRLKNKIDLFKNVIKELAEPYKKRALDELKILEDYYQNDFEL